MKRFYSFLAILLMTGMLSCKKNDNSDMDVKPVTVSFKFSYDVDNASLGLSLEKIQVKLTNLTTSQVYNAVTGADGIATFKNLAPGNYDINSTQTLTAPDYNEKAGTNLTESIVFNGTLNRQSLTKDEQRSITLKTGRVGDLVIKQIYYAGSNVTKGAVFRDQFVEIYNNSSEVIYADSLYFGQVQNVASVATKIDQNKGFYLPAGQYDWTKSIKMNNTKANTDYVYMTTLFMIPGTGKQYPIAPGKSIIIAATAINHKSPFVGADGKTISVQDPSLTVDLSQADFEVYLGDQEGISPLASDVDNPLVPNMKVVSTGGNRDLVIDVLGRDGIVIFKTNEDPKKWPSYPTPDVTQIITTTKMYIQVPVNIIIDGVGLQHTVPASRIPKYMNDTIDAGETYVTAGSYQSQSVVRKTNKTVNGRIVLKDTNNSTNDFGTLGKADPSKSASSFIN
ncbi:hypothetical protein DBR11_09625 [Pedobacter sp. HMWF019]|uniref:DUF4876 domain-containing protein n=1 Tax=Pedobacter sp. HMWF019 TaxID=2056856 RepID=UPI000D3995D5|nr:DUF4876 domain-containing protein [Pedobacter sp. HMWF019]PTT00535.1 hypothetical protein DBR11_09625 [Pedobacter sp. HMWF019]